MGFQPIRKITEDEIRTYEEDGIVCLRQLYDAETVNMLRDVVERDMVQPGPMALDATREGRGRFFADTFVWKHYDELKDFVFNSSAADVASAIMRSPKINILFDQFLVKEPGTTTPTLWHHDQTYWPVAGDQFKIVQFEMEPGDCTLHHGLTVHGAPGNSSLSQKRRAYIIRWAGEDATYYPRPNLQPMLHDPEIDVNGPLDCSLFSAVRTLAA